ALPIYPALAAHTCHLIVMHSVQGRGKAQIQPSDPETIVARVCSFFEARLQALTRAGIGEARIILDPGMGFFLGEDARCSLNVLKALPKIKAQFGRPVLISVSRKAFLRSLAGANLADSGPATLAAELFAARQGADFIRTHDVKVLRQGLAIQAALGDD
ncbi:MAG TPA: hypothetical protein DCL48_15020, partial [Alphaproteobacteria bacterium]|nr:hypothetical protein [Alphaproteobacteria bacterium]